MSAMNFKSDARLSDGQRSLLREFCSDLEGNIVQLANHLGLKVYAESLLPYDSGFLEYAPKCGSPSEYRIVVNRNHPPTRQRFTVAHEMAHFLLHRDRSDFPVRNCATHRSSDHFKYLEVGDTRMEAEANLFAANLLMPANLFKPAYVRLRGDVQQLATLFDVSEQAVRRRCRELRLG